MDPMLRHLAGEVSPSSLGERRGVVGRCDDDIGLSSLDWPICRVRFQSFKRPSARPTFICRQPKQPPCRYGQT
eukprot:2479203-Pyramimonas_sp.AAC.1